MEKVLIEEYRVASASLDQYERFLVNSTPMLFTFAIPLSAVSIGALEFEPAVREFAAVVGLLISIGMWISVERIRIVYWKKFHHLISMENNLGISFWTKELERFKTGSLFMRLTPSPARLRSTYYFVSVSIFSYTCIKLFNVGIIWSSALSSISSIIGFFTRLFS